jgi:hypothetical protein
LAPQDQDLFYCKITRLLASQYIMNYIVLHVVDKIQTLDNQIIADERTETDPSIHVERTLKCDRREKLTEQTPYR